MFRIALFLVCLSNLVAAQNPPRNTLESEATDSAPVRRLIEFFRTPAKRGFMRYHGARGGDIGGE